MRQERAKPLLSQLKKWIDDIKPTVLPKSRLGEALTYATNQWVALNRYLEHGDLCIDNNASERALRTVAVGRKNWMFAGSDEGGRRAANFYTLIASAKANGVEPFAYLRSLFELLPTWPTGRLHELWPAAWKARYQPG
jgi:transposase